MKKILFGSSRIVERIVFSICSLVVLVGCSQEARHEMEAREWLCIEATALTPVTKVTMSDDGDESAFSFETGDKIGLFAEGKLNNIKLACSNGAAGSFEGSIRVSGEQMVSAASVNYYAYYPYSETAGSDPAAVAGTLPYRQTAPYDSDADYLVADVESNEYDVNNFPTLSLAFSSHLFAIVKMSVTNTSDSYSGEQIYSIGLRHTGGNALAGQFTFDVSEPTDSPAFSENVNYLSDQVIVEYPEASRPTLGTGTTHSVYAIVKASDYASGALELVVHTTNYTFRKASVKALSLRRDQVTVLEAADVNVMTRTNRVRTLVLWGDSITGHSLLLAVQNQLGANWNVIRGGVAGDSAQQVASRQGGLPMYTGTSAFTIPASSEEYVYIDGIYYKDGDTYGHATSEWTFKDGYMPQLNPLIILGVECEISYDTELGIRRIRRLADGAAVNVPARTEVSTYGSRAYADADVIVVEMGGNSRTTDSKLIGYHNAMKAHMTNPEAEMIVNGFCMSSTDWPSHWTSAYVAAFTEEYGNYFIDQRTEAGGVNAVPMMKYIGQITDESQISDADWVYIDRGDWPVSWFRTPTDIHPNDQYGAQVMAIVLRRRMATLGLL